MERENIDIGKFFLYIMGKVLVFVLGACMVVFGFFTALNSMDVYMMTKDAFAKRTSVILNPLDNDDAKLLDNLFTKDFLAKTGLDTQEKNASYIITNYDERTEIKFKLVFPWQDTCAISVENTVQDIKAKVSPGAITVNAVDKFIESGDYIVHAVKESDGSWKVDELELVEEITPKSVLPIPTQEPADDSGTSDEAVSDDPAPTASK